MSHALARTLAMPGTHVAFAFSRITTAAISPPRLPTRPAAPSMPGGVAAASHLADAVAISFPTRVRPTPAPECCASYQGGAPTASPDTSASTPSLRHQTPPILPALARCRGRYPTPAARGERARPRLAAPPS